MRLAIQQLQKQEYGVVLVIKIAYFLFHPHGLFANGGGDVMLKNVYEFIDKEENFSVKKFNIWDRRADFDIFHLFASNAAVSEIYKPLRSLKKPLVVSAMDYSNMSYLKLKTYKFLQKYYPFPNVYRYRQELFDYASVIIVNSYAEKKFLLNYFDIDKNKIKVIPVGVSSKFYTVKSDIFVKKYHLKNYILCVGRINPRKGQIKIIKALKDLDFNIVFIGLADPSFKNYFEEFLKEIKKYSNIHYIGQLDFDSDMLISAYQNAILHILPSDPPEFPGIASMEAGLAGCKVVTTFAPALKDTFKDYAYYCKSDIDSIRKTVFKALSQPKNDRLKNHLINFTWEQIIKQYLKIYEAMQ